MTKNSVFYFSDKFYTSNGQLRLIENRKEKTYDDVAERSVFLEVDPAVLVSLNHRVRNCVISTRHDNHNRHL